MKKCSVDQAETDKQQAAIAQLSKPALPPPRPDLHARLGTVQTAVETSEAFVQALIGKRADFEARLAGAQADLEASALALTKAEQQHKDAMESLAAVRVAVDAQGQRQTLLRCPRLRRRRPIRCFRQTRRPCLRHVR